MRRRFDIVETTILAALCAAAAFALAPRQIIAPGPTLVEEDVLEEAKAKYGPSKFSQGPEEWLIRDFFDDERAGTFVDVGSFDPVQLSNTYRLERDLDWSGIAIDALRDFAPRYAAERSKTRFVIGFVADKDEGTSKIYVSPSALEVSSGSKQFTELFTSKPESRDVPVRTLDGILKDAGLERFDLLSMDIELGEPLALQHFTISKYRPRLAVVEAHGETRQAILDYFARVNYVLVGRYLHADTQNLYFRPSE